MDEVYIESQDILLTTIKEWTTDQLEQDQEYNLCDNMSEDLIEPSGITLLKTSSDSIKVSIDLDGSAKHWNHLFSLPSYITAMKDAIANFDTLELDGWDIEERNHMFINYGFTAFQYTTVSDILIKAESYKSEVEKKTVEILVEQANKL
ncbi:hypothetical protein QTG56_24815 (plasmid) [Rossellomorea sp. AcN35-11]|nr:hypothetical protein [Rossellomorea aquimaris]WJV31858.1 hypothetical protein QTG56_24815 [Rossellomorea sp. AcN35-11]